MKKKENLDLVEDQFIHSLTIFFPLFTMCSFLLYFYSLKMFKILALIGFFLYAKVFEKQSRPRFPFLSKFRERTSTVRFFIFWATTRNI